MENKESQEKSIIFYLMKGGRINVPKSTSMFGCVRLAARIYDLRCKGWIIRDEWITLPNKKRVKEYFI
jgi:hypothetical protein